jgi:hypothetical protein
MLWYTTHATWKYRPIGLKVITGDRHGRKTKSLCSLCNKKAGQKRKSISNEITLMDILYISVTFARNLTLRVGADYIYKTKHETYGLTEKKKGSNLIIN